MNVKFCLAAIAIAVALPLAAQSEGAPPAPPAPQDPAPAAEQPKQAPELAETLAALKKSIDLFGRLKVSGYLQAQYVEDERSRDQLGGSSGTRNLDQFSVRRGRVKFVYQASETSRFVLQPDITSSGVTLKDGYVELIEPWTTWKHTLTAGQFNWPFGYEIAYSSSSREMPERPRVIRTLFPGERDRGVMMSGRGFDKRFRYQVALVNGTGTSSSNDLNQEKDVVGRVAWAFGAVDLGASIYRGTDLVATSSDPAGAGFDKERQGVDVLWKTPLPGLRLRGEYITGRQAPSAGTTRSESFDVAGWYVYAIQEVGTRHQFVLRADAYDGNRDADDDAVRTLGGAYSFKWDEHSKVMLAYEHPENEAADVADDVLTVRYQFSF